MIAPPSPPAFIPVEIAEAARDVVSMQDKMQDLARHEPGARPAKPEASGLLPSPARVSASLPNGVKLTLECGDVDALTAIIGALGHV